jgi:hypothetical protein
LLKINDAILGMNRYYQYYAFNLILTNLYHLVAFESDPKLRSYYLKIFNDIYAEAGDTKNVYFNAMHMALNNSATPQEIKRNEDVLATFPVAPLYHRDSYPPERALDYRSVVLAETHKMFPNVKPFRQFMILSKEPYDLAYRASQSEFIWEDTPNAVCYSPVKQGWWAKDKLVQSLGLTDPKYAGCQANRADVTIVTSGTDFEIAYWMLRNLSNK